MVKAKVVLLIFLSFVVVALGFFAFFDGEITFGNDENGEMSVTTTTSNSNHRVGDTLEINGITITVNDVYSRHDEGNSDANYVIVDISVTNEKHSSYEFSLHKVTLNDEEGYGYEHTTRTETKGILGGQISEGRTVRGEVAFKVPTTDQSFEFVYTDHLRTGQLVWELQENELNEESHE
ncbi:DUF4352 domain-containing protein [Alkalihalobacillus sp. LMS39]|uniref:DUF4352 domain-containing protein n=1 Tax=Alkalihalobacillus sp. LMS39 TaxID=2924032 RepID=UPI001FB2421D|nr:DUF4352 domain-containing protein [Alkalihalobacillus sp. LMS39]UOE92639.1 DUF4352 domain-containing protein [Alkalihalobacillus sp. LMS39]